MFCLLTDSHAERGVFVSTLSWSQDQVLLQNDSATITCGLWTRQESLRTTQWIPASSTYQSKSGLLCDLWCVCVCVCDFLPARDILKDYTVVLESCCACCWTVFPPTDSTQWSFHRGTTLRGQGEMVAFTCLDFALNVLLIVFCLFVCLFFKIKRIKLLVKYQSLDFSSAGCRACSCLTDSSWRCDVPPHFNLNLYPQPQPVVLWDA